ncbi:DUF859 family phage minor structural protein [Streptococcus anginosus]|uniref:DUF859 family phage minor structural protein n=1 Tax=Streptococcus anginosus TaxID=1328 RepID=UPI00069DB0E7|nr:DUF859 family phage minor structural protein [Streptococcus anginosus]
MARAIFSGDHGNHLQLEVFSAWNSPNIADNYSTVNVQVRLIADGYARIWGAEGTLLSLDIGGIREDARVDASIFPGQNISLFAKDYRVNHDADGKKSINISATLHVNLGKYGSATASFNLTLTNIPRASSITAPNSVIGSNINITVNRAVNTFKHAIRCVWYGKNTVIANDVDTNFAWTIPKDFANDIPNSESGQGTLIVETYSGGKKIGEKSTTFTATVPDDIKPKLTGFTLTDGNAAANNVVPGEQAFISVLSNIKVNFGQATGAYGSTITGYYAEIVGKNQSTTTQGGSLGIMNYIGDVTIRARVTDSRGRISNTIDRTVNILEYFSPVLKFDVTRSGTESSTLTITRNAKVAPLTVNGSQKNLMKLTFKVAPARTTTYTVDNGPATGIWTSVSSLVNSNANLQGTYIANKSWAIIGILEDKFTRTEFSAVVGTEAVVISYGKDRIGFGKIAEKPNVVDSDWEYHFKGNPIQNRRLTNSDGRSLTNIYKTVDEYVTTGFYYVDDKKLPDPAGGYLLVESYSVDFIKQTYTPWNKSCEFTRQKRGKDKPWSAWVSPALEQCYPIGSIYQSTVATNPAQFMGGVWERFGNGRVLIGVDETDADFNTANKQGGSSTVPNISISPKGYGLASTGSFEARILVGPVNMSANESPLNASNLQPYITVYRWRRTA